MRCSHAFVSRVLVVAVGRGRPVLDGEESGSPSVYATDCVPPGVTRVAFVTCGSTGRSGGGVASSMSPELYGARMTLIRLGVGVSGGGLMLEFLLFLRGVTGASGTLNSFSSFALVSSSVDPLFDFFVVFPDGADVAVRFLVATLVCSVPFGKLTEGNVTDAILVDLRMVIFSMSVPTFTVALAWVC